MTVSRFGVSLEEELLKALDEYVQENSFANRSQAIRFLIEKHLVEHKWKCDNLVAGTITLVYDKSKTEIHTRLQEIKSAHTEFILSTQILYMDSQCMEIIAVKGKSFDLTNFSDKLITIKGIQHGKLTMSKVS